MKHFASPAFWSHYRALPAEVSVGEYWSARVGLHYRAIGVDDEGGILWFWLGTHAEYDKLIG